MDPGKILIANLAKGKIGEDNSALLGAMLTTKMELTALSRQDIPEEQRETSISTLMSFPVILQRAFLPRFQKRANTGFV